jgi:beta-barrel assembly-enhancing protease
MIKVIREGLILFIVFFSLWFMLNRINWFFLKPDFLTLSQKAEGAIGSMVWKSIQQNHTETRRASLRRPIDTLFLHICDANPAQCPKYRFHIIESKNVNAFALPGNRVVLTTGIIESTHNPEELSGIIAHELAHLSLNHVTQKIIREVGLIALLSMNNKGGSETALKLARVLMSRSFERNQENEADRLAMELLLNADIDPSHLGNFLMRVSAQDHPSASYLTWLSTHPDSQERSDQIFIYLHKEGSTDHAPKTFKNILSWNSWERLKKDITKINLDL